MKKISRILTQFLAKYTIRDNKIRHYMPTLMYSKEGSVPNEFLMNISLKAIAHAFNNELSVGNLNLYDHQYLNVFPGEHYRLLNGFVSVSGAKNIVEIGTWTGLGTVSLLNSLINSGSVTTFDILEWNNLPNGLGTHLSKSDVDAGKVIQIISDIAIEESFNKHMHIFDKADIIFLDAPKDDKFEYFFAENLKKLNNKVGRLLIIDDINFVNMIDFWRAISSPKIDLTSFGHWSGTGVVDISNGFSFTSLK